MIARPKHQRLALVLLALAAVMGAVLLAMLGLKDRAAYFYTPAEVVAGQAVQGRAMRLGGMVQRGSVRQGEDGVTTQFVVEDGDARIAVVYRGILPDLFREGSGVVAEGMLGPGRTFVAENILAKHDERYMPPQLGNQAAEHGVARTLER